MRGNLLGNLNPDVADSLPTLPAMLLPGLDRIRERMWNPFGVNLAYHGRWCSRGFGGAVTSATHTCMIAWQAYKLKSKDPAARCEAVKAIAAQQSDRGFKLLETALNDSDPEVLREAVRGIAEYKDDLAALTLRKKLGHPNPELRQAAASAIGRMGFKGAEEELAALLQDPGCGVRTAAALALQRLGWKAGTAEQTAAVELLCGNVRSAALAGATAIDPLLQGLKHDTAFVRRSVAEAMDHVSDPRVVDALAAAASDSDDSVRISVIHTLSKLAGDPKISSLLKDLLKDSNSRVRLAAAEVLAGRGNPEDADAMMALARDTSFEVRMWVARYVARTGNPGLAQGVLSLLRDRDCDVRREAASAIGVCADHSSIKYLVLALADEDSSVRQAVLAALNAMDPRWRELPEVGAAASELEEAMVRRPAWVRSSVAQILAPSPVGDTTLALSLH